MKQKQKQRIMNEKLLQDKRRLTLISHRGNINGRSLSDENQPLYIDEAIEAGYDVKIDLWFEKESNKFYLGNYEADYQVDVDWLGDRSTSLWIQCKNMDALSYFNEYEAEVSNQFNYFSHDLDIGVLTSHKYIWSTNLYDRGILVLPEVFKREPIETTMGICSYIIQYYNK